VLSAADIDPEISALQTVRVELDAQSRQGHSLAVSRWADSGAMALSGPADGPPDVAPAAIAPRIDALALGIARATDALSQQVQLWGVELLGERAAIAGLTRRGSISVGGAARMVAAADGWLALNLARPEDVECVPALVGEALDPTDWSSVEKAVAGRRLVDLVEIGVLLGMPLAAIPDTLQPAPDEPWEVLHVGSQRGRVPNRPLVIDLTSLWAGPLAGSILCAAGARVIKVESRRRPDGTRSGPPDFFDLLNAGKEMVALDFRDPEDRGRLHALLASADLVLEGSRARVMAELGIDPAELADTGVSWISLTGYGRLGLSGNRVGFGDDAAVAGGLFVAGVPPRFVADAAADPIAGLAAGLVALTLLAGETAAVVDVPLSRAAAWARGDDDPSQVDVFRQGGVWVVNDEQRSLVRVPRSRRAAGRAAALGAQTADVLAAL